MKISMRITAVVVALALAQAFAAEDTSSVRVKMGVGLGFYFNYVVNSSMIRQYDHDDIAWMDSKFFPTMMTSLYTQAVVQKKLRIFLKLETGLSYSYTGYSSPDIKPQRAAAAGKNQAYAAYYFATIEKPNSPFLTIGMFDYYYAPESRTFGEYMFTTGTYPGTITCGDSIVEVNGLQFTGWWPAMLRHDIFIAVQMAAAPVNDISPTYIASANWPAVQVSAGVMLDRIIQNRSRFTNPRQAKTTTDMIQNGYVRAPGDTVWYSKSGVKLMGRACLDIKKVFGISERLGREDLKLYTEAALLGAKNYDGYYEHISERVPVMLGLNLPAFKLLDFCALEMQYYGSPWRNDGGYGQALTPYIDYDWDQFDVNWIFDPKAPRKDSRNRGETDNLKWAFIATRTISRAQLSLRAASDYWGGHFYKPKEWYWGFSVLASF